jgi:hypothetical protein
MEDIISPKAHIPQWPKNRPNNFLARICPAAEMPGQKTEESGGRNPLRRSFLGPWGADWAATPHLVRFSGTARRSGQIALGRTWRPADSA